MNKMYDDSDEYKKAVLSDYIKSNEIMKEITLPKSVYKYRKFDVTIHSRFFGTSKKSGWTVIVCPLFWSIDILC